MGKKLERKIYLAFPKRGSPFFLMNDNRTITKSITAVQKEFEFLIQT